MKKTILLIVDNQPIFRSGVRRALAQEEGLDSLEILDCDPGNNGDEALRQIKDNSPDVVILDVECPMFNGLDLIRNITSQFTETRVIALSANFNANQMYEVTKTGAAAYMSRDSSAVDLSGAMRRAASGDCPINDTFDEEPDIEEHILKQYQEMTSNVPDYVPNKNDIIAPLTSKEIEFLNMMAENSWNGLIAEILGLSDQDVKSCVNTIIRKLNASDRAHAVMLELCKSWLSFQDGDEDISQLILQIPVDQVEVKKNGPTKRTTSTKKTSKSQRGNSKKSSKPKATARKS